MIKGGARLFLATSMLALTQAAQGETISYSYDPLGRLIRVSRSGPVTATADYSYDSADNRTNVSVSTGAAPPPPPPSPPPPPPPPTPSGNRPPVAVGDGGEVMMCQYQNAFWVLDNDYDPDGNTPLTLVGVSYSGSLGSAHESAPRIIFRSNGSGTGSAVVTYTVSDSLGATATGTLTVNVVQGQC